MIIGELLGTENETKTDEQVVANSFDLAPGLMGVFWRLPHPAVLFQSDPLGLERADQWQLLLDRKFPSALGGLLDDAGRVLPGAAQEGDVDEGGGQQGSLAWAFCLVSAKMSSKSAWTSWMPAAALAWHQAKNRGVASSNVSWLLTSNSISLPKVSALRLCSVTTPAIRSLLLS